nr:hypothetical protein CFP56_71333 [Quercus suber]
MPGSVTAGLGCRPDLSIVTMLGLVTRSKLTVVVSPCTCAVDDVAEVIQRKQWVRFMFPVMYVKILLGEGSARPRCLNGTQWGYESTRAHRIQHENSGPDDSNMGSIQDTTADTVRATLAFRLDPALGGCDHHSVWDPQIPKRDVQDVTIHEISGREQQFTNDLAGFQFMHHKSEVLDLDLQDDEVVSSKYYDEVCSLVKTMSDSRLATL